MISELISKEYIKLNVEAENWEEAIRICGNIFINNGNTEKGYADAMIKTVKDMGQYIVIEKGIAMPHARPEDGVKKVGIGIVKLRTPVEFGNEEYDPVDILFSICAVDKTSHVEALAELMNLIEDEKFLNIIRTASSENEIIKYIQSKKFD